MSNGCQIDTPEDIRRVAQKVILRDGSAFILFLHSIQPLSNHFRNLFRFLSISEDASQNQAGQ